MQTFKYHPEVGLPEGLQLPVGVFKMRGTQHAHHQAEQRQVWLPTTIDTRRAQVFEVVTDERERVIKLGLRLPFVGSLDLDLCLIVNIEEWEWECVTCWVNDKRDKHATLKRHEYTLPA